MDHCMRVSFDGILSIYESSFMFKQIFKNGFVGRDGFVDFVYCI